MKLSINTYISISLAVLVLTAESVLNSAFTNQPTMQGLSTYSQTKLDTDTSPVQAIIEIEHFNGTKLSARSKRSIGLHPKMIKLNKRTFGLLSDEALTTVAAANGGFLVGNLVAGLLKLVVFLLPTWITIPVLIGETLIAGILLGRLAQIRLSPAVSGTVGQVTTTTVPPPVPPVPGTASAQFFGGINLSGPGIRVTAEIGTCVDVPPAANKRFSSIDTQGNCLIVCNAPACAGTCYSLSNAGIVNDLGSFRLMISSFQFC